MHRNFFYHNVIFNILLQPSQPIPAFHLGHVGTTTEGRFVVSILIICSEPNDAVKLQICFETAPQKIIFPAGKTPAGKNISKGWILFLHQFRDGINHFLGERDELL